MSEQRRAGCRGNLYFVAAVLATTVAVGAVFSHRSRALSAQRFAAHIGTWFNGPGAAARLMQERYGPPDVLAPNVATWYGRWPWKRITVRGEEPFNYLEQAVGYQARPEAAERVLEFGQGTRLDLAKEELSAASNSEALNFLALNMAEEVAAGKRSPEGAQVFYFKTARLAASGKSSPYAEKLCFVPYRPLPQNPWNREIGY